MSMMTVISSEASTADRADDCELPHVLLVLDQFPKTLGGGERIVLRLASLLPKYGYRTSILTFAIHPECTALEVPPCPIYLLPLRRTYDWTALRAAFEFRRFLRSKQIKLVQTFFESSDIWAGTVTKFMSDAKLIWSRRDLGILRGRKHRIAYRIMASVPDAVFAVSEQVRKFCVDVDRINPAHVHTIYNGLDLCDWTVAPHRHTTRNNFVITTVGNIRRVKGHDVLIRAAAIVVRQFPSAIFSVAGEILDQDYFAELQSLVEALKLSQHFRFVGGVTNLREHLFAADVFVLPSRSEGFSNALIEAMAASLPIVATNVGGNAEAVKDGINGIIVQPDDPETLAQAILTILSDPRRAASMGIAGKQLVAERFTTEAMMNQITTAYQQLLTAR